MLGDNSCHGPLLLMWCVVQQLIDPHATTAIKKLGNKAMELRAFTYLKTHLEREPFSGETVSDLISGGIVQILHQVLLLQTK